MTSWNFRFGALAHWRSPGGRFTIGYTLRSACFGFSPSDIGLPAPYGGIVGLYGETRIRSSLLASTFAAASGVTGGENA